MTLNSLEKDVVKLWLTVIKQVEIAKIYTE